MIVDNSYIIGEVKGSDTVIGIVGKDKDSRTIIRLKCSNCGEERDVLLKRFNYGTHKQCFCMPGTRLGYENFLGKEYYGYKVIDLIGENPRKFILQCTTCGDKKEVGAKNIAKRISKEMPLAECNNCIKILSKQKALLHQEDRTLKEENRLTEIDKHNLEKYREYIGKIYGNNKLINILSIQDKSYIKELGVNALVECILCNEQRIVSASRLIQNNFRRIPRCKCEISGDNTYKSYIGKDCFNDIVINYISTHKENSSFFEKHFVLKCKNCGEVRNIENVAAVIRNIKLYEDNKPEPENFWYKKCNCIKGTRDTNVLDRYKKYIGKRVDNTFLTALDFELGKNNKVWAHFRCDCGNVCFKPFHHVQYGHITSCGHIGMSLGEVLVEEILKELNINYRKQVQLPDLTNDRGNKLKFDFAIKLEDESYGVIEYDGEQHYDPYQCDFEYHLVNFEEYEKIVKNDSIKNEYCKLHGYKILRLRDKLFHNNKEAIRNEIISFFNIKQ